MTVRTLFLLTVGGRDLWHEEDTLRVKEDILEPNGLIAHKQIRHHDILLCELDPTRITLSEYYHWNEITPGEDKFCWRPFHWIETSASSSSSSSSSSSLPFFPHLEHLGSYACQDILIAITSHHSTTHHTS